MKQTFFIIIGCMGLMAGASASSALSLGCESAVNLDVKYNDAGAPNTSSSTSSSSSSSSSSSGAVGEAGNGTDNDGSALEGPAIAHNELEACPCDQAQGLACCVSPVGPAFCTTDQDRCNAEQGGFYRCFAGDPTSESACCWSGAGAGAITAYAAECKDGRLTACLEDAHCPSKAAGSCHRRTCSGITYGACEQDAPECPPGTN